MSTENSQKLNKKQIDQLWNESRIVANYILKSKMIKNDKNITGINGEGVAIPYHNLKGEIIGYRVRLNSPINGIKYLQKKGSRLNIYFLLDEIEKLRDSSIPLLIVEGEKKTLSACCNTEEQKFAVCGIPGCWNWKDSQKDGLAPIWDDVSLSGRDVYIVGDSDIYTNYNVFRAYEELAKNLVERGAKVRMVDLREVQ